MPAEEMETTPSAYKNSTVQLSLVSVMMVAGLSGFSGGLAWAIITELMEFIGLIHLDTFSSFIANIITFPMIGLFFGAFFAFVGYPIFKSICRRFKGLKLSGLFIN